MMIHVNCAKCKMVFGIPDYFQQSMKALGDKGSFLCPAGHFNYYPHGETEEAILRRERDRLKQQLAERDDYISEKNKRIEELNRKNAATRGVVTRIKNRVSHGVCPCCNRTFANLMRHMKTKHPAYNEKEAA